MQARQRTYTHRLRRHLAIVALLWCATLSAQVTTTDTIRSNDDIIIFDDSARLAIDADTAISRVGQKRQRKQRDWNTWKPSPKKAVWLALIPGAGQIYNRKYWKLPIVYGAFTGCAYAIRWNNMMYTDYKQAYKDITDDDPTTESYNKLLHLGTEVTDDNIERYTELFRKRKDYYRRYRDMSIIITAAVYALSIIDAYVDASLSDFDISKDISMRIEPTLINNSINSTSLKDTALGVKCVLFF